MSQAVGALVRQLEQELNPPPPPREQTLSPPITARTNAPKAAPAELAHAAIPQKVPGANLPHSVPAPRADSNNIAKTAPALAVKPLPVTNPPPRERVELVNVGAEPEIKPAHDLIGQAPAARSREPQAASETSSTTSPAGETKPQKRSFFQRINPINLFTHEGKSSTDSTPLMASTATRSAEQAQSVAIGNSTSSTTADLRRFPRYPFRSPQKPPAGDRDLAQRAFAQGVQQQQARNFPEAIQAYRRAAQLDPSFYDAHYNLGLAASQNGNLSLALAAYETALAIQPESLEARYNFALVLKQAGYVIDAEAELERILAKFPNDGRTHLALGNLYAQQLQNPAKAREQYLAVLAVAPQSPQAGAIRYWLTDHPK